MKRALLVLVTTCGTSPAPAAPHCDIVMTGDLDASASVATCGAITADDAGESSLVVDTTTADIGRVQVIVDLGGSPVAGTLSSDDGVAWSALEVGLGDAGCAFGGGSDVIPHGSFTLAWSPDDAGAPHGTLDVTMATHAPPGSSCGPSDVEHVHVGF